MKETFYTKCFSSDLFFLSSYIDKLIENIYKHVQSKGFIWA